MIATLGKGALLGKMDIKSAFRLLPIFPGDFDLLGIYFRGFYFIDKCLPMGCSLSCALFEKFSSFLQWVLVVESGLQSVDHYLDDFLFAGPSNLSDCQTLMSYFADICKSLGVPLAQEKTVGPTTHLTFLGLEIDTSTLEVKIPDDKLTKLSAQLLDILSKRNVKLADLEAVTGLMSFCARAVPCSRAFLRRFYDVIAAFKRKNPKHFYTIRITRTLREDFRIWQLFLKNFNGISYISQQKWLSNNKLQLFTDSSGNKELGCGAYFNGRWIQFSWPPNWANKDLIRDMTFLELIPVVLAFLTWKKYLKQNCVILNIDNSALVSIINKQSSKSPRVMHFLRPLVLELLINNIQVKAKYIESSKNNIADSLSRFQEQRFRELVPMARKFPDPIPVSFLEAVSKVELTNS
ncbi:hypothetical protein SNE40_021042 [Patella caerulea]|uniref:Reverse transcriptase domain-containing protein n=1 Tax=Patella caerulea TaxID=87958 RepID=A0AAN8J4H5_PATCE